METSESYFFISLKLLGSLALLMYGMKLMSDTLQKMAGPQLRHVLGRMTTNRFTGMFTGVFVTAAVQSSTATTVMTVSFVNAGLLTLAQAISVIMGANIGTTLTAWIMSAGFSFNITDFVWPAYVVALFLIYKKKHENVGEFIFGVATMILGLGTLRQTGVDMNLGENEAVLSFFSSFDPQSFLTTLLFLLIGGVLTMCVQSSAAVMAITMILCSSGALPIYQGIALVLGENIGTTVTSNLAALTASTQARRAAFAHMFFNLFGVFWILIVFQPFINMVCALVGYDVTMAKDAVSSEVFLANAAKLSFVLAAFHTCFNLCNTGILIWFIPQIEKIVCFVIKERKLASDEDDVVRLQYIDGGLMNTPEISVLQAQKEIGLFGERMQRMFSMVPALMEEKDMEQFAKTYSRIEKYEGISDNMELEIAKYLEQVSDRHLSDETKAKIRLMMREVSELESIGDACYNMARTLNRKQSIHEDFSPAQQEAVGQMMQLCHEALGQMQTALTSPDATTAQGAAKAMERTRATENAINLLRNRLKAENIAAVNEHQYSYALGTSYIDLINECEKLGDYVVNVVEARLDR